MASLRDSAATLAEQITDIRHQVTPNHGGSMNDAQRRTEKAVAGLGEKLDQHIGISKRYDAEQESTARKLDKHFEDTGKWTGMLTDLHRGYANKPRNT